MNEDAQLNQAPPGISWEGIALNNSPPGGAPLELSNAGVHGIAQSPAVEGSSPQASWGISCEGIALTNSTPQGAP